MMAQITGRVTIKEIAQACGVGVTTVSRALNDAPDVNAHTRKRVLKMARTMGYTPNLHARKLRQTTSDSVALVVKGPSNPFFLEMLDVFEAKIRERGMHVTMLRVPHGEDEVQAALQHTATAHPAAVVFLGGQLDGSRKQFEALGAPFVLCTIPHNEALKPDAYSSVALDDQLALTQIVEYLADLGHEEIGFIGSDTADNSVGELRSHYFRAAMRTRFGSNTTPAVLRGPVQDTPYSYHYGLQLGYEMLSKHPQVTAIVGMTDVIALGVMRAVLDMGLRVPEAVSVVGIDGVEIAAYSHPRLTTIRQPLHDLVERTCEALFAAMRGEAARHLLLPGELVVRSSTGPVRNTIFAEQPVWRSRA